MFQSHEKKLVYFTLGIFASLFLVGLIVIFPQLRGILKTNRQFFEMRSLLETKYEKTRQLHKSQLNLGAARQTVQDLQKIFLTKGEEIKFVSALENLAEKYSLEQKLSLSPLSKKEENPEKIGLQINLKGEFKNLMEYLSALEKNDYLISYYDFSLARETPPVLSLSIKSYVYIKN